MNSSIPQKILVVAAHPDDEILGCGASIKKWTVAGAEAYALILAQGIASRVSESSLSISEKISMLQSDSISAARIIGYNEVFFEQFPDNRMDSVDLLDVIQRVEKYIMKIKPTTILTHHNGDLNIDHQITYRSVVTACRPISDSTIKSIYSFQIPSSTEWSFPYHQSTFSPNTFVDVTETIFAKTEALACYKSEIREAPHPRSPEILEAIARQWGSVVNVNYAEALELIYTIIH